MTTHIAIEFGDVTLEALRDLQKLEELSPATIVNRAVQLYQVLLGFQRAGGAIYVQRSRDDEEVFRLRWE